MVKAYSQMIGFCVEPRSNAALRSAAERGLRALTIAVEAMVLAFWYTHRRQFVRVADFALSVPNWRGTAT